MTTGKIFKASPETSELMQDLMDVLNAYPDRTPMEMIIVLSHLIGYSITFLEESKYLGIVQETVSQNIRLGNQHAVSCLMGHSQGTA